MNSKEIAKLITDEVIKGLKSNPGKWIKSWTVDRPRNMVSGRHYTGGNWMWLSMMTGKENVGKSQMWATYSQAKELTGLDKPIKKGMKSVPVFFYKPWATEDKFTGEDKLIQLMKVYRLFNRDAIEGTVEIPIPEEESFRKENVEKVIVNTGAELEEGHSKACYIPSRDLIQVPKITKFKTPEDYYATTLHELTHWTGHEKRLDRKLNEGRFGNKAYAFEELVAELGSAMLCNANGIEGRMQHVEYINSWLEVLEKDSKNVLKAAAQAQKAFDFIMKTPKFEEMANVSK